MLIVITRNHLTRPRGPSLGAKAEADPISPPTALSRTTVNTPLALLNRLG